MELELQGVATGSLSQSVYQLLARAVGDEGNIPAVLPSLPGIGKKTQVPKFLLGLEQL